VAALEGKYDSQFRVVFDAIRALMEPPEYVNLIWPHLDHLFWPHPFG
jgi:hypothetical protein